MSPVFWIRYAVLRGGLDFGLLDFDLCLENEEMFN